VYISQDPIRLAGGLTLYGYVGDPLWASDPFGEVALDATGYVVYHIKNKRGRVVYVGITNHFNRRKGEHIESGRLTADYDMIPAAHDLKYAQARGYEQADIRRYRTRDTSRINVAIRAGEPNRCWSYAESRVHDGDDLRARAFHRYEREREAQHRRRKAGC
jgi:predicted GIY-YIG superfamily endonuclease